METQLPLRPLILIRNRTACKAECALLPCKQRGLHSSWPAKYIFLCKLKFTAWLTLFENMQIGTLSSLSKMSHIEAAQTWQLSEYRTGREEYIENAKRGSCAGMQYHRLHLVACVTLVLGKHHGAVCDS